ncbi:HAD family hydrolase [Halobacteria archaeon AArc-curdl1]|uniref:HAD family hydrolase n=1 Tax=Natronosalvus hydrolyticus TaxID=2979988 RepID=A0AAP2Z993_9EURY|nr:HAD family hydrolase [Halobacteria archaeon AArc-curdl1]
MTEYDIALFDSDGILVDPPAYETQVEATVTAFEAVGVTAVDQRHLDDIVNGTTVGRLQEICSVYDIDPETFWEARERHDEQSQFEKFEAGSRGLYDDIDALSTLSLPCGVVSNNHHSTIAFVLEYFELAPLFEVYYGRAKTVESLDLKKPNTHYLEKALADLEGESALYIGDSENDVVAAHRAGIDSVFVRRPHSTDVALSATPTYEVESLHAITDILNS